MATEQEFYNWLWEKWLVDEVEFRELPSYRKTKYRSDYNDYVQSSKSEKLNYA
jgi:hypothetical protein